MLLAGAGGYKRPGDTPKVRACCAGLATADNGRPPFLTNGQKNTGGAKHITSYYLLFPISSKSVYRPPHGLLGCASIHNSRTRSWTPSHSDIAPLGPRPPLVSGTARFERILETRGCSTRAWARTVLWRGTRPGPLHPPSHLLSPTPTLFFGICRRA